MQELSQVLACARTPQEYLLTTDSSVSDCARHPVLLRDKIYRTFTTHNLSNCDGKTQILNEFLAALPVTTNRVGRSVRMAVSGQPILSQAILTPCISGAQAAEFVALSMLSLQPPTPSPPPFSTSVFKYVLSLPASGSSYAATHCVCNQNMSLK